MQYRCHAHANHEAAVDTLIEYDAAVETLIEKMGWNGNWVAGSLPGSFTHVYVRTLE